MDELSIQGLSDLIGGRVQRDSTPPPCGPQEPIGRIAVEAREVAAGDVFWALEAEACARAAQVREALARGARGLVVPDAAFTWPRLSQTPGIADASLRDAVSLAERAAYGAFQPPAGCFAIVVEDTHEALQRLAIWHRQRVTARVIAVAGGPGKTTTRRMIDAVLSGSFSGRSPVSDGNHPWSLPLALLQLQRQDDYGLLEYHASRKNEIRSVSHLCQPEIGVINSLAQNVSPSENEGERCELEWLQDLPEHGWAVLSGDEPRLGDWADRVKTQVMLVGRGSHCDLNATHVHCGQGELKFVVEGTECTVRTWGRHALHAALTAFAVGRIMGLSAREVAARLREFQPLAHRCQVACQNGITVIDDTYDGQFASWRAALEVLREVETQGRRIVVCGGLEESGHGPQPQREIGRAAVVRCGADWLIAGGPAGRTVVEAAQAAGMPASRAVWRPQIKDAAAQLQYVVQPGDAVLVKGGGEAAWEQVVQPVLGRPLASAA
ncbi:MAG TPA: UDP-N-acetylmuramoyl-tripeptide--D-alanyl-D-alanine ligase [Candidatus Anammoximicrobium sp.]|nr:UDP-N-acetylmuramoyl-tripeptide--D-alanyl-D-alanine ligase [Candidatus Anammoximicrobium sp.]